MKKNKIYLTTTEKDKTPIKYLFSEGHLLHDELTSEELGYNENGELTEKIISIKDKNKHTLKFFSYNSYGECISEIEHIYEYNCLGNEISLRIIEDGKLDSEQLSTYNNENLLVLETTYDFEGNDYLTEIFYDEFNRQKRLEFRTNGSIDLIVEIEFDLKNNSEISKEYNSSKILIDKSIIYYDENNLPTKYEKYDLNDNVISHSITKYKNQKKIEEIDFDENDNIIKISKIRFYAKQEYEKMKENYYYENGVEIKKEIFEYIYE
ncbi:MAG: hypothetical protein WAR79_14145 [Melioribacteraceae bacterium]